MWNVALKTKLTRDSILITLGVIGFLHELFLPGPTERPFMLALIGSCLGLPLVLRGEEKILNGKAKD